MWDAAATPLSAYICRYEFRSSAADTAAAAATAGSLLLLVLARWCCCCCLSVYIRRCSVIHSLSVYISCSPLLLLPLLVNIGQIFMQCY